MKDPKWLEVFKEELKKALHVDFMDIGMRGPLDVAYIFRALAMLADKMMEEEPDPQPHKRHLLEALSVVSWGLFLSHIGLEPTPRLKAAEWFFKECGPILVWHWPHAPKEVTEFIKPIGGEEWVAFLPERFLEEHDVPPFLWEGSSFGRTKVRELDVEIDGLGKGKLLVGCNIG